MLNKTIKLLLLGLMGLAFGVVSAFWSKQITSNTVKAQSEIPKLSLEISNSKDNYLRAEPVLLNIKLSNQTDQPISWRGLLGVGSNINFVIQDINGKKSRWEGNKYAEGSFYSILKVMHQQEEIQQPLFLNKDLVETLFSTPGQYTLQVEFVYNTDSETAQRTAIFSNSIIINILEPKGIDRQAYLYLKETLDPTLSKSNTRELAQVQQEFVDKFRGSIYAKYIIVDLAATYQTLGEDEKALRELCKISGENFYFSKSVVNALNRIDAKLHPVVLTPLPENVPAPPYQNHCRVLRN